jgi:hypothetical protein
MPEKESKKKGFSFSRLFFFRSCFLTPSTEREDFPVFINAAHLNRIHHPHKLCSFLLLFMLLLEYSS